MKKTGNLHSSCPNPRRVDKTLLLMGRSIEKSLLWVKEKGSTTYVASDWIAGQRFFRNMG
jgi:hypothetical protein